MSAQQSHPEFPSRKKGFLKMDDSGVPPLQRRRLEATLDAHSTSGNAGAAAASQESYSECKSTTFFVHCKQIVNRGDLLNGFFSCHREKLGLSDFFSDAQGALRSPPSIAIEADVECKLIIRNDAPVECVYIRTSKKPFFLVEFGGDLNSDPKFASRLLELNGTQHNGAVITIAHASPGITVRSERIKQEQREKMNRQKITSSSCSPDIEKHGRHPEAPTTDTTTAFVPRVVQRRIG